jgi:uncharacterized membrane protein
MAQQGSEPERHPTAGMGLGRLEALTDGVFAIAITLMVFEIRLPEVNDAGLARAVAELWPFFLAYAISFGLLGIYWLGSRSQFHYIKASDHALNWLGLLLLALVSLVPFSTRVLSVHPLHAIAIAIYGGNLIAIGLALFATWRYATRGRRLVDPDLSPFVVRFAASRCLLAPAIYALAVAIGFVGPWVSLALFALVPFLYVIPRLQPLWARAVRRPGD